MTRVLVVDDKDENLYYLKALLTGHGYEVIEARHGAEALVKARQQVPDLAVSDLLMPVMDGYTLLRHWKADATLRSRPFIVYTATYTEAEDERLAYSLGADAFILKPAEPDDFLQQIRDVEGRLGTPAGVSLQMPSGDEAAVLKVYSETLIRKLEEKTLQLEESNRLLQQDVARRKAVEAALRASEAELRLITEVIPQIVWRARPDGWHTHFNKQWLTYTGLSLDESLGHGWLRTLHPDDRQRSRARWQEAVSTAQPYEIEYRMRRADGRYHWMLGRALPLQDSDGRVLQWFGTCTDIDDLKVAEARITEQASLLEKTRDAISVRTLDHRVTYMNRSSERIYGWRAGEAKGQSAVDLLRPEPTVFAEAMRQVLAEGEWTGELQTRTKTGAPRTMDCRWTLVRGEGGAADTILAIETDVTERTVLAQQFMRAQRLESIGTLAGGIAHDLNNSLAPIMLSLELLRTTTDEAGRRDLIDLIEASATRGTAMVRQVLSFARGVEGRLVPVQVAQVIHEIQKIANDTFLKNVIVRTSVPGSLPSVVGDPTQLHQVLLNLCVNARDAMPDGGVLHVTAAEAALTEQEAQRHPDASPGAYVVVSVADTGTGMTRETLDRIFEPFFTTKDVGHGTGLGLSTSLAIVRSHRGFIDVESTPSLGTTFRVWLPVATDVEAAAPPVEPTPLPRGNGELILVVDDEQANREMTARTLEAFGYRTLVAGDGVEALEHCAAQTDAISAVITDMMMPVMDGRALIDALRERAPSLAVIATSGLDLDDRGHRGGHAPLPLFLAKPYTTDALLTLLDRVVARA